MRWYYWLPYGVLLLSLFYVWPNLIHEPAHFAALKMQGSSGEVHFDWTHFPAHPYIQRTSEVKGVAGGLLYLLAPSFIEIAVIGFLWKMRKRATFVSVAVSIYLAFDLIVNMLKYSTAISDFHFMVAVPAGGFWMLILSVCVVGVMVSLLRTSLKVVAENGKDSLRVAC